MVKIYWAALIMLPFLVNGQSWQGKFEQLGPDLPTPNSYRTAAGRPGHAYWQQKVDYTIAVSLDEENLVLSGSEEVVLHNNSPQTLKYLWFQLDQNVRKKGSLAWQAETSEIMGDMEAEQMMQITDERFYDGGYSIEDVIGFNGLPLNYTINQTMMRVDLSEPLAAGESVAVQIKWHYNLYDRLTVDGRGGYEYFPKDDNYLFTVAQWYPRMAVFDDVEGWQNKQFLGDGEFALSFGDFDVTITVPNDHIVAATGEIQNLNEVLNEAQLKRYKKAINSTEPVFIVTEKDARRAEKNKASGLKTWHYRASNVRDFAFASSRKFIWDAMKVELESTSPIAMSFYPKEGNPIWEEYSTRAVANALKTYSRMTFDYPYPVAISVHAANQGMEYPMICFNMGRPESDGKYSKWKLYDMVAVIVHEVGHNYFPMIVNTDERQWTWQDEGINTFLEQLTMDEYYPEFELTWGKPESVTKYMRGDPDYIRPLMTNSEQLAQFGYNGYGKPSAALCVLRDVVMGPELFDYSFKTYAKSWAFKRPMPADFFRIMEDASAIDLDWFWRGWFYSIDYVDIDLTGVNWYVIKEGTNSTESITVSEESKNNLLSEPISLYLEETQDGEYREFRNRIDNQFILKANKGKYLYELHFANLGGLVSPIILQWRYDDGSVESEILPAEIWRMNEEKITKVFLKEKKVVSVMVDPDQKTGDAYIFNNSFPRVPESSRFKDFIENQK